MRIADGQVPAVVADKGHNGPADFRGSPVSTPAAWPVAGVHDPIEIQPPVGPSPTRGSDR
jgi:hypothetical protein